MQNWNGPVGPVTVRSVHGHVWTFPSLVEAARWLARTGHRVSEQLPAAYWDLSPIRAEAALWGGTVVVVGAAASGSTRGSTGRSCTALLMNDAQICAG